MKPTSHRFDLSILITTILLLASLSCETSLQVNAKRVFRPDRQSAAKLELAQSVAITPGAFIAGPKGLGKRDGLVKKHDEEVGFYSRPRTPPQAIKRGA